MFFICSLQKKSSEPQATRGMWALPAQIDEKKEPQATYQDGILRISLQLAKQGETKKIPIRSGGSSRSGNPKK